MNKQSLTEEERRLLIAYCIQRAKETVTEADIMIKDGFYIAAVLNTLPDGMPFCPLGQYIQYSCFYPQRSVRGNLFRQDIVGTDYTSLLC
jgi:hypothetical protein